MASILPDFLTSTMTVAATAVVGINNNNNNNNNINTSSSPSDDVSTTPSTTTIISTTTPDELILSTSTTNSTSRPRLGTAELNPDASDIVPLYMQHMTVILVILHLSVFITGLVGNSLVCLSVYRNKSLQTVTNYYIVNLAVADFLVILICLPPTVYWDLTLTWNFGLVLCKLVLYLQSISVSVSVLTLTCISIDRWYAICRPLEFCSTKSRAKRMIAMIWVVSMIIASPDVIFLTTRPLYEEDDYVYTDCTYSWPEENTKIYQLCIVSLLFILPFVFMIISYSHIVNVLWRNETMTESIQHSFQAEEKQNNQQQRRAEPLRHNSNHVQDQERAQTGRNITKSDLSTMTTQIHQQYHGHSNQQTDLGSANKRTCLLNGGNVLLVDDVDIDVNDSRVANNGSHRSGHRKVKAYEIGKINTNDWRGKKHHPRTYDASGDGDRCAFCMDDNVEPISLDTIKESQCCSFESTSIGRLNANSSGRKRIRPHKQHNGCRHQQQQCCGQHQSQRHHHHHHHRRHHQHHHHRHHNHHNVMAMGKRACCPVLTAPNCNKHDLSVKPRSLASVEVDVAKTQNTSLSSAAPHEHSDRIYAGLIASSSNNNTNNKEGDADDNNKKLKDQAAQLNGSIGSVCLEGKGGKCRGNLGDKTIEAKRIMSNNITGSSSSSVPSRLVVEMGRDLSEASGPVIISERDSRQVDDNHDARDHHCDIGRPFRNPSILKNISDQSNSVSGRRSSVKNPDNNNDNCLASDVDKTTVDFTVPLIEQSESSADDKNDYGAEIRSLMGPRERGRAKWSTRNSHESNGLVPFKLSDPTTCLEMSSSDEILIDSSRGSSGQKKFNQAALVNEETEHSNSSQTKTNATVMLARNSISNDNETPSRRSSTKSLDMLPSPSLNAHTGQSLSSSSSSSSTEEIDRRRASSGCTVIDLSYANATKVRNGENWHLYTNTVDGCITGQGNNDKSNGCNPITTQASDVGYSKMQQEANGSCFIKRKCILASSDQCLVRGSGQRDGLECGACLITRSNENNGSTMVGCNDNKNSSNQLLNRDQSESKKGSRSRQPIRTVVLNTHVVNDIDCSHDTSHYKTAIINNTSRPPNNKVELRPGSREEEGDRMGATTARRVILGHKPRLKFNESQWHSAFGQGDQSDAIDIFKEKNNTIRSDDHERKGKQKLLSRSRNRCKAMMATMRTSSSDKRSSISSHNKIDCNDSSDNQTKPRGRESEGLLANGITTTNNNNSLMISSNQHRPAYRLASSSNTNSINTQFYKLIESRKKAAKMLIVIVIMFGLCYLPIHFLNTLRYTIGLPQNDITTIASLVSHWLCYFNSAVNPLIYNLMSDVSGELLTLVDYYLHVEITNGHTAHSTSSYSETSKTGLAAIRAGSWELWKIEMVTTDGKTSIKYIETDRWTKNIIGLKKFTSRDSNRPITRRLLLESKGSI